VADDPVVPLRQLRQPSSQWGVSGPYLTPESPH
jgi:hypothetical protein